MAEKRRGKSKGEIRSDRRQRSQSRKRRKRTIYVIIGSAFALLFILSLTLSPGLGGSNNSKSEEPILGVNTGGPVPLDPDRGREHVITNQPATAYSNLPATSGPHWVGPETPAGVPAPARWGIYDWELPDEVLVHNLEHGGIGLHYNCPDGCDDLVNDLKSLIPENPSQFILSPYPNMESKIAITGWRHHMLLNNLELGKILEFIDAYQDRGPESVPYNQY